MDVTWPNYYNYYYIIFKRLYLFWVYSKYLWMEIKPSIRTLYCSVLMLLAFPNQSVIILLLCIFTIISPMRQFFCCSYVVWNVVFCSSSIKAISEWFQRLRGWMYLYTKVLFYNTTLQLYNNFTQSFLALREHNASDDYRSLVIRISSREFVQLGDTCVEFVRTYKQNNVTTMWCLDYRNCIVYLLVYIHVHVYVCIDRLWFVYALE